MRFRHIGHSLAAVWGSTETVDLHDDKRVYLRVNETGLARLRYVTPVEAALIRAAMAAECP